MPIPFGILENDVAKLIGGRRERLRAASQHCPAKFAAGLNVEVHRRAGARIRGSRVHSFRRFHLAGGQAGGLVARFALDGFGIEVAARGIFDQTVLHSVGGVASFQHGLVNDGILVGRNVVVRVQNALRQPDLPGREARSGIGSRAGDDAVVIVGKPLRFLQPLPAAGGTSVPVRHAAEQRRSNASMTDFAFRSFRARPDIRNQSAFRDVDARNCRVAPTWPVSVDDVA